MRDLDEIDSQLRLAALVRATVRQAGGSPSMVGVDAPESAR
ncbi:hypothetical protein [Mycolicibacterium sp. CBMA 361]|nr:hypothetical protein [Mycolicibacterium sp. CBMA 361]